MRESQSSKGSKMKVTQQGDWEKDDVLFVYQ